MACPICGGMDLSLLYTLHDDRYGYPMDVQLMVCASCGHKFSDALLDENMLSTLYTQYYPRAAFNPTSFRPYKEPLRAVGWLNGDDSAAARWVPAGVRVLDIGCGLGCNVAYHAARGCDSYGIDADLNVKVIAEKYGLKIDVGLFAPASYKPDFFDYVTLDQVVEHVTDPVSTLTGINRVLKQGGRCVISTPNANGWGAWLWGAKWLNWHVPYHQQFISERSMILLAEKTGFVVERFSTITRSAWVIYQIAHLLTYPTKGKSSYFWAPNKNKLRFYHVLMLKFLMAARLTLVPQMITRLFDAIGCGDNYLVVIKKV